MSDDNDVPELDPPDADEVYANYLETCRRLGVEPVSRERARELVTEFSANVFVIDLSTTALASPRFV